LRARDSGDPRVVRLRVDSILYAYLSVCSYDWWGVGSNQDYRFPTALAVARRTPLRWAILYEPEGYGDPSVDQIRSDLVHIRDRFASKPAYLKLDGRFVVYVYGNRPDDCSTVDRWRRANTVGAYLVMKAIGDNRSCPAQPDGWFQYSGNRYEHDLESDFFGICAGYEKTGVQVAPALPRISLDAWRQAIRDMVASGARNQLVVSFNEWGEASAVESALEWETPSGYGAYLDALHEELPPIGSGA